MKNQSERWPYVPRAASEAGRGSEVYIVESPQEPCPLFDYCLIETAFSQSVDLVFDLRAGRTPVLLAQPKIQRGLGLIYERLPEGWEDVRAQPLLVARFLESLVESWPSILPLRILLIYERGAHWWVGAVIERCRARGEEVRVEWVNWMEGACHPARCSLLHPNEGRSPGTGEPPRSFGDEELKVSLLVRQQPVVWLPASRDLWPLTE